ncbi:hypothetical protein [Sphingobacterium multivorum]
MAELLETVSIGTLLASVTEVAKVWRDLWKVSSWAISHKSAISLR